MSLTGFNPKVNTTALNAFLVALLEKHYENKGETVTEEQIDIIRENYPDNEFIDNDEFVAYFEEHTWTDELAEKYGEIGNEGNGYYFVDPDDND